jgi:A/G-specific adenine glycosylase
MQPEPRARGRSLSRTLLRWYRSNRRDLPWRRRPTLYRTLVAEFMLQQTRVDQALPYYRRFLDAFPRMKVLARAPLNQVLKQWEGLGYYSRARNLHESAKKLARLRAASAKDLEGCPGIGPYTLAAVSSIVWGVPRPVLDGNVKRVLSRMLALPIPPDDPEGKKLIGGTLDRWIDRKSPGDWNQGLMELGATVCLPRRPLCLFCPVRTRCKAHERGDVEAYPIRKTKPPRPHRQVVAAVIRRHDRRILIAQRPSKGLLGNLWEFPGGKLEARESLKACCRREIREELGIDIRVGGKIAEIEHAYTHFSITLHVFECSHLRGKPKAIGCQAWRWVRPRELEQFPFPKANWPIIEQLCKSA